MQIAKHKYNNFQTAEKIRANDSIQKLLNWFVFFLAFPVLTVLGNSVTFYIFIAIVIKVGLFWKNTFQYKSLFVSLSLIIIASSFLAPFSEMERFPGLLNTIQFILQYFYWILASMFFIVYYKKINLLEISKWVFYGILISILGFYFIPIDFNLGIVGITTALTRNSFIFDLICGVPICFYYLKKEASKTQLKLALIGFLLVFLFTNGRSGAIIGILEILLIAVVIFPGWLKVFRIIAIPIVLLFVTIQTEQAQVYLDVLANKVENINPRFASLLKAEGEGDLNEDKSWLHRKLMVDKGFEIITKYPFLGIGPNNFKYYDSELETYRHYTRLTNLSLSYYNKRSAHNSYIQIMSETGILGLCLMLIIMGIPILFFIKKIYKSTITDTYLPFISLLGMSMHFYAISALTGAIPWFIIGLSYVAILKIKQSK
jgi:O-antigen ligase